METPYGRAKVIGNKKQIVNRNNTIDNIYKHSLSVAIADGSASESDVFKKLVAAVNIQARDSRTGETFFHVLSRSAHHYTDAKTVGIFYDLGTKIDLDVQDHLGDTVLHKICVVPGAWRCIVAVQRCGASPRIRNNMGLTPDELILQQKRERWEENLYWLRKFSPGLWHFTTEDEAESANCRAARLLKAWCRASKVFGDNLVSLKSHCLMRNLDLLCVVMLEKYEISNEVVIAMLSGSMEMLDAILNSDAARKVNADIMDHFYQYSFRDSPTAPRPLLAAVWETENYEMVKRLMVLKPNTSVKYTFEAESSSPPKPLFFHLVNPKSRPENPKITAAVLQGSDLALRNEKAETILFEAIYNCETETVIQAILNSRVNIAARDFKGRTARDHCVLLERNDYKGLIDSHVIKLATDLNVAAIENLILQMYDHFPNECKAQVSQMPKSDCQEHALKMLKNVHCIQTTLKKLFTVVEEGNFTHFSKILSTQPSQYARACDKAGRSLLHLAVQFSGTVPYENNRVSVDVADEEILDTVDTVSIDRNNQEIEPMPDTDKLYSDCPEKKRCIVGLFCRKSYKPDFVSIIDYLLREHPQITSFTNNLGQTALHSAYIYAASKPVLEVLDKAGNYNQVEDIFGYIPKDYSRELCGEQTYQSRRKPVDEMDLNIFLVESQFEHHLKKSIQTGHMCRLRSLINPLMSYGGEPYYNHVLFDCLDANRISLASYLIHKGFSTNISKQYDTCNPDNAMCAMMECTHAVTTLRQRAEQVGATDLISLINKRSKDKVYQ